MLVVAKISLAAPVTSEQAVKIYLQDCAVCHGEKGDSDTGSRFSLRPPPRDFTTAGAAAELTRERMIRSVTFAGMFTVPNWLVTSTRFP